MEKPKQIDAELEPMLQFYPAVELNLKNLNERREQMAQLVKEMNAQLPEIKGVIAENLSVTGPENDPDVMIRVYKPEEPKDQLPGVLWIHGGGYVSGNIEQEDILCRQMVKDIRCVIISVEYRRAPEHPYPAPLEDCYASLKWMHEHAQEHGIDNSRIAIGGPSAGGGLTAGLALLARDRAEVEVVFQLLIYPMIDDCNIASASDELPDTLIWSRHNNHFGWSSYLDGNAGSENVAPYAAAIRATDLSNLPPAFIAVGDLDLFVDENIEYAQGLIRAGVSTELHVYPGAYHGFNFFVPNAKVSQRCNAEINQALRSAFSI